MSKPLELTEAQLELIRRSLWGEESADKMWVVVRNLVLEEAAKVCERDWEEAKARHAEHYYDAAWLIRDLKGKPQP